MELRIVKADWKKGIKKETGKEWVGIDLTLQGTEKFTVSKMIFISDTQAQLLGLEKPKN